MAGSKHRVLFQNADDNINMGVIFNDPDLELDDIYWYMVLAEEMRSALKKGGGLITVDKELNTQSCYVELHRKSEPLSNGLIKTQFLDFFLHAHFMFPYESHPVGFNGQNHITAVTPLQFLPAKLFQKRQKAIDSNRKLAIMSSMMNTQTNIIEKKKRAKELKEKGNLAFKRKRFEEAEAGF